MILLSLLIGFIVVAVISAIIALIPAALCLWIVSGMLGLLAWTFWQWFIVWFAVILIYTLIFKPNVTVNKD